MDSNLAELLIDSFPKILIPGLVYTLPLAFVSFAIALVIATAVALIQYARVPVLRQLARFYIWVVRGTPLLVQLYVVFFGLPDFGIVLDPLPTAVLVLSINTGAYSAETMRAALESVPVGQLEAGYCVGMSYLQVMRRIVLPQALRTAFPPLSNELIALVKDTSLAANIMVAEMFRAAQEIVSREWVTMPLYLEVAAIYLLFSTVLTWLQRLGERKLAAQGMERG
ncbi:ABC transporter permease subunit [Collinsella intestinalis]|uniref:ABC transporter permease subunit n=1 Tax=Collinsella intestinalis TaxID=147207 RepID=UPI001959323C|nr:amino acid ABC transporter permease [Collinsella intestinalis]